jgi:hypothetical protein
MFGMVHQWPAARQAIFDAATKMLIKSGIAASLSDCRFAFRLEHLRELICFHPGAFRHFASGLVSHGLISHLSPSTPNGTLLRHWRHIV